MSFPILGLHHVTATVDDAQADLDFAKSALGLRLVKKTVNFDNHSVYHFYYGDERGTPGTIWTTFPYKGKGVPVGVQGAGQVTTTSFSLPTDSISFWKERLETCGYGVDDGSPRFGETSLSMLDPSGLVIELIEANDKRAPWIPGNDTIDLSNAIRGLHSVTLTVRYAGPTIDFLKEWLGYSIIDKMGSTTRVGVNGGGAGKTVDVVESSDAAAAKNGLGTVHHVAMAIESPDEQMRLRTELTSHGVQVTPLMDRQYFQSIYFREPGGILYEVATMKPGFAVDEPLPDLGRSLKLPPSAEGRRSEIEQQLAAVKY